MPSAKPPTASAARAQTRCAKPQRLLMALWCAFARPLSWGRSPDALGRSSHRVARAGRIAPVAVNRILAVPEPSGRAVTWAREAADRFEAELAVFALDPDEPDPAAAIVREASERGSDLIVLSDAGMRDRTEFLLANVANRVSHAARCSVVFVADGSGPVRRRGAARAPARPRRRDRPRVRASRTARRPPGRGPGAPAARGARGARPDVRQARAGAVDAPRPAAARVHRRARPPAGRHAAALAGRGRDGAGSRARRALGGRVRAHRADDRSRPARSPRCTAPRCRTARPSYSRCSARARERQILEDLALLELFAEKAGNRPAFERVVDLPAVFAYLSESLRRELDFSVEAASLERIRPLLPTSPASTLRACTRSSRHAACS